MKFALIGCGRISPNHLEAAKANGLEIAAICDLLPEAMDEKATAHALPDRCERFLDYEEMLAVIEPELVAICTESGKHAEQAIACMRAGAHVIVEKPLALSIQDCDAIIEAERETGKFACACHQNRFNKSIQEIRKAMDQGRFGKLLHGAAHVRWNRGAHYYAKAPWRGTWAQDGGCLMNQCIHNLDLLRWMMGDEVQEVMAYTDQLLHPCMEAEDLGLAIFRFANGSYGIFDGTVNVFPKNLEETLYLFGETGTVKVGGKSVNRLEEWRFQEEREDAEAIKASCSEDPPNIYGHGHTPLYADVLAAIREGRPPAIDAKAGKRAVEMVLAIYQSAALGRPVRLPLEDVASTDFAGRFEALASM